MQYPRIIDEILATAAIGLPFGIVLWGNLPSQRRKHAETLKAQREAMTQDERDQFDLERWASHF